MTFRRLWLNFIVVLAQCISFACSTTPRSQLSEFSTEKELQELNQKRVDSLDKNSEAESIKKQNSAAVKKENYIDVATAQKKKIIENFRIEYTSDSERAMHYFMLGQAYSLNNEVEAAIEAYRQTITYDPNSALVYSRLSAELVKLGDFPSAKAACEKAIKIDNKFIDAYLLLAGIQVVSKEMDAALKTYEKVLKIAPENRDALLYYGTTLAEAGKLTLANKTIKKLVKLEEDPNSQVDPAVAWYYLAKVETQQDKFDNAAFSLKQSLKERPGFAKAAIFLADLYLAQSKAEKSIKVLEEAYKENQNAIIASRLASYYMSQSQFEKSVPYLETVVESDIENVSAKVRLGLVYWQIQWLDKAYTTLKEIEEKFPESSEVLFYIGELELERENPNEAIQYLDRIPVEYARFEEVASRVVAAYQFLNKKEEAKKYLEKTIQKRKDIISLYTSLAKLLEDENKHNHAIRILEANIENISKDETALYYLGYLYDRVGEKKSGAKIMKEILNKNPNNPNALNYLGYSLLEENGDLDEAEKYITRAHALKPNDAYILDSYGWLLFKKGRMNKAVKMVERAVELKPQEGIIREHLADIYVEYNRKHQALDAYEKALEHLNDSKDQTRVNQKIQNIAEAIGTQKVSRTPSAISEVSSKSNAK